MAKWLIQEKDDGTVSLLRNRRWHSNHDDIDQAAAFVRQKMEPGDSLIHEAPDGYRTKKGPRRGWRQ